MVTRIYGASDDLIEADGDVSGEHSQYGTDDAKSGVLLAFSDGTLLDVKYGKNDLGIWRVSLLRKGDLFDRIEECTDEDADVHSDVAHFKDGLKWCYIAPEWSKLT